MLCLIHIDIKGDQIVAIDVRIANNWEVITTYRTKVEERGGIEAAIRPIGTLLSRSDILAFCTQKERDAFVRVSKRYLNKPVLAKSRIIPINITPTPCKDLELLLQHIKDTGLSVPDFISKLAR